MKIYKYILKAIGLNLIQTYAGAAILSAGIDPNGDICVWMLVDTKQPVADRAIEVFGTGWELEEDFNSIFIGTVNTGLYMWHIFDAGKPLTRENS